MRLHVVFLSVAAVLLAPVFPSGLRAAPPTDITAFSSAAASPNILLLLDTSGSMTRCIGEIKCDKKKEVCGSGNHNKSCYLNGPLQAKSEVATEAIVAMLNKVNPVDGSGGRIENARFGLGIYGKNKGAYSIVHVGSGTTDAIIAHLGSFAGLDNLWGIGANTHGVAQTDMARYIAYPNQFGTLPLWGTILSSDEKHFEVPPFIPPEALYGQPSFIDSECRQTFMIILADGLWGYKASETLDRYGSCTTGTCFDESIGDLDGDGSIWMDDVSLAMYQHDFAPSLPGVQNVVTHVIGFFVDDPLLTDTANQGGGTYVTVQDADQTEAALVGAAQAIFDGLVSFTSATVASSRTAFSDGMFNSYFHAKSDEAFWAGHLEAYRLSAELEILDKNGDPAVDPATGLFVEPRRPYWDLQTRLLAADHPTRTIYMTKSDERKVFTTAEVDPADFDLDSSDLPSYPNDPNVPFADVEVLSDAIVNYLWGQDAFDEDRDTSTTEKRVAILGDIFHSSPTVIGSPPISLSFEDGFGPPEQSGTFLNLYSQRKRRLYVGANDGMLHAVDAGEFRTGDNPSTPETENGYYDLGTGNEIFAWVPGLLLDTIKYIPRNVPRTYFYVDGTPSAADAWFPDSTSDTTKEASEWTTVLMTGMRRGGDGYIALDITDPDATGSPHGPYPKLLWEFEDSSGKLGQTWSEPIITRIKVKGPSSSGDQCGPDDGDGDCREQWVAIFGGGYEEIADTVLASYISDPNHASWTDKSKAIYVVALDSGSLLARVSYDPNDPTLSQMRYAIPTTPAVLDLDFDGFADSIYAGDVGGQLWKWDISEVGSDGSDSDSLIDSWSVGVFFNTPPVNVGGGTLHYRSIFFPPTATYIDGELILSFATGERTNLHYTGVPTADENNRFYVVKDLTPMGSGSIPSSPNTESDLTEISATASDPDPTDLGFYFVAEDGEKFTTNHIAFGGFLITTSYVPQQSSDPCTGGGGVAYLYIFDLETGTGFFDASASPGAQGRRLQIGSGVPSDPRISTSDGNSTIIVQTSSGAVVGFDGPDTDNAPVQRVYWKQDF